MGPVADPASTIVMICNQGMAADARGVDEAGKAVLDLDLAARHEHLKVRV